jgi:hypothetical protein
MTFWQPRDNRPGGDCRNCNQPLSAHEPMAESCPRPPCERQPSDDSLVNGAAHLASGCEPDALYDRCVDRVVDACAAALCSAPDASTRRTWQSFMYTAMAMRPPARRATMEQERLKRARA